MEAAAVANSIGTGSTSNSNSAVSGESETRRSFTGYIFMCNPSTKLECYQYRVFGLPSGRKDVVEQIKPGAKLFLYDFELKLLYGVYEATCVGKMNLEPTAFRGKFPAQVKFKIYKECLPMPESTLRSVIWENYSGSKFKQELSWEQVQKMISSFRSLYAPPYQPAAQAPPSSSLPHTILPNQFRHTGRLPAPEVSYLPRPTMYHTLIPAFAEHQPVPSANPLLHGYHKPPESNYAAHGMQDALYSRYTSSQIHPQLHPQLIQPQTQPHSQLMQSQTQLHPQLMQPQTQPQPYVPRARPGRILLSHASHVANRVDRH